MVELLRASVLSDDEKATISRLSAKMRRKERSLTRLERYYDGVQRIEHIGLAVPEELRHFMTVINIPRIAVDEPTLRQAIRSFYRAGDSTKEDPALRAAWEYNNLASTSTIVHTDEKIFGHTFVSVGTNPEDEEQPLITAEDPREIACDIDPRNRQITDLLRLYRDEDARLTRGVLMRKGVTIPLVRTSKGFEIDDDQVTSFGRDDHGLEAIPVVMFTHRRRGRSWSGMSEMSDVMPMTDDIARLMSNMIVNSESLALPHRWAAGMSKDDFVDKNGKPLPTWEAYMTAIKATANKDAKFGQFDAAQLSNFYDTVNNMFAWCAAILGLPTRFAGQQTTNPASEGAIRADESRLIARVERMNRSDGDSWAWVMGLEERIRTGSWGDRNSVRVIWRDPGTQTHSQIADAATKYRQVGALSVEGMWDMLEWDEPRKELERGRLKAEREASGDPDIARLTGALASGTA